VLIAVEGPVDYELFTAAALQVAVQTFSKALASAKEHLARSLLK
jgi:hypothetical protein